ncbi:MAG TPA: hypothetical protein VIQ03_11385 [Gammaproteobacteria bacterium]
MNNNLTKVFSVLTFLLASNGFAAGAPVTHQFQGGQPASASQVNENFQELADRISDIPAPTVTASYDYRQYLSNVSSKVFSVRGSTTTCDTETYTYARTQNGDNTDITVTRTATDNGTPCYMFIQYFTATPTQYELHASDSIDPITSDVTGHDRFEPTQIFDINPMQLGRLYSFHSENFYTPRVGTELSNGFMLRDITVIAVEDVTVPAGTFTGCLKIHRISHSRSSTSPSLTWHCPTVGEVKYIYISGSNVIKELTSYTP